jgi:hypothetical protein
MKRSVWFSTFLFAAALSPVFLTVVRKAACSNQSCDVGAFEVQP